MIELLRIVNNTFDNAHWKYDPWNISLLFNTKEHGSVKEGFYFLKKNIES